MRARGVGYDSGGIPGVTEQAYAAFNRWRRQHKLRNYGRIGGRDAWSALPMKGARALDAQRLVVTYPDTQRKANVRAGAGQVPLATFNATTFKDALAGQLKCAEPGAGYVHFPAEMRSKEKPHTLFEQLTAEDRDSQGRWAKRSPHARNEMLDMFVMARAIAHLQGIGKLNWDSPPIWAASWDRNSMVSHNPAPVSGTPRAEPPPVSQAKRVEAAPGAMPPAGAPPKQAGGIHRFV